LADVTDALIGSRIHIAYDDQNEAFASYLPVDGTVSRRCTASTGPTDWYLVDLDEAIHYQHATSPPGPFSRLIVSSVLVRSRWNEVPLGAANTEPSAFLLLVRDDQKILSDPLTVQDFLHVCWVRCRVRPAKERTPT
jgi:hypothetical protein